MTRVWMAIVLLALLLLAQLAAILAPFRALWAIIKGDYIRALEILKAYDRLGNATVNGDSEETISSHANRARNEGRGWGCKLCEVLDKIEKDHCANSAGV